jgi:hypothetical protein
LGGMAQKIPKQIKNKVFFNMEKIDEETKCRKFRLYHSVRNYLSYPEVCRHQGHVWWIDLPTVFRNTGSF